MAIKTMVGNEKGGTGKSTTAVELAYILSVTMGRRVLVVDLDQQGNASNRLCEMSAVKYRVFDWLTRDIKKSEALTPSKYSDKLFAIVASKQQANISDGLFDQLEYPEPKTVLKQKVAEYDKFFDHIIFDCDSSLNFLTQSALRACDNLLVPTELSNDGKSGAKTMLKLVSSLQKAGHTLNCCGVLVCNYDAPNLAETKMMIKTFEQEFGEKLISTKIYARHDVLKANNRYLTISAANKNHPVSKQYRSVVNDIFNIEREGAQCL